ncbi:MAG TPA: SOS response-associated peptidase family protein, partial [Candidatus Binatia bacterium]
LFGFAGLWDCWKPPNGAGGDYYSFTIITTPPNELLAPVHDRMPAILRTEDEERWLDPQLRRPQQLLAMLKPYPAEEMEGYEVSRAVNSPLNDGPECVAAFVEQPSLYGR